MNLEQVLEEWKKDCRIDPMAIDESARATPELHAKYLGMLSQSKLKLKQLEFKQKALMKLKWLWYNGKMSQEETIELGWDPDPFDGLKILKGDMEHYVEADPELVESEAKLEYAKTLIETLKEIVQNLNWRHQTIKNIIDYKKFEAGF
jgi:hypothetical protein|tara:strand:- start:9542 stop:9985 length:444 start_codon:yes stop_codon:yes gene_type:complete